MSVINWTDYFMEIAKTVSLRSNCIRRQVGAIIVDEHKKIKASGYNGTPSKVISCNERGICYRIEHNIESGTQYETCRSIHAEQNAIIQAGEEKTRNGIMYIFGHDFICILCKRFIVQSGIKEVYLKKDADAQIVHILVEDIREQLCENNS